MTTRNLMPSAVALLVCSAAPALAQEIEGGVVFTYGITQEIRSQSNPGLAVPAAAHSVRGTTRLRFGVVTETRTDRLAFSASGTVEEGGGRASGLATSSAELDYLRRGANAEFSVRAFRRDTAVDTLDFLSGEDDAGEPILTATVGQGTQRRQGGRLGFEFGKLAPFGGTVSLGVTETDYIGTTDPDLVSNRRDNARMSLRFALSEITDLTASGALSHLKETGAVRETTRAYTVGLKHQRPNGFYKIDAQYNRTADGARQSYTLGRSVDLPTGKLWAWFGVSNRISGGSQAIGGVDWSHERPNGSVTLGFSSRVTGNARNEENRVTRLRLGLSHRLSPRVEGKFGVGLANAQDTATGLATRSADISASVSYELAQDWQLNFGATHRRRDEDGVGRADSTELFVSFSRDFKVRR